MFIKFTLDTYNFEFQKKIFLRIREKIVLKTVNIYLSLYFLIFFYLPTSLFEQFRVLKLK